MTHKVFIFSPLFNHNSKYLVVLFSVQLFHSTRFSSVVAMLTPTMSSLFRSLHWLRVSERITYRLAVIVYHCLHDSAPAYLSSELFPPFLVSQDGSSMAVIIINHRPGQSRSSPCHDRRTCFHCLYHIGME